MPKITAKTSFAHGSLDLKKGDTAEVSAATARDLRRAGHIEGPEEGEDDEDEPATPAAAPDDLKMAASAQNKRAADPANKAATTSTTAASPARK